MSKKQEINNKFYLLGKDMSNRYPYEMIKEYIEGLNHSDKCSRKVKGYVKGDGRIAMIELPRDNKRYYVYTCRDCGGNYFSQENMEEVHYLKGSD